MDLDHRRLTALKDHAPETEPGTAFHYANLGYMIVGAMIEKASGEPWESLIRKRIFEPLGLQTAGLGPQATTGKFDAPVGHQIGDDDKILPMPWGDAADVPQAIGPAGSAHMSVLDFAKWAAWNAAEGRRGPSIVKPETLRDLASSPCEDWTAPWSQARHSSGRRICARLGRDQVRLGAEASARAQRVEQHELRQNSDRSGPGSRRRRGSQCRTGAFRKSNERGDGNALSTISRAE